MAQQPEDKNQAKGFSGLDSMVSDVSKDVEHAERVGRSSQSRSEEAAPQVSNQAATEPVTAESVKNRTEASSGASGIKWVFGAAALIFVIWLVGKSSKQETTPTYSPPSVAAPAPSPAVVSPPVPAPVPAQPAAPRPSGLTGEKPPVGEAHVLDREQIRYCLSEKVRLDAIEPLVNTSRNFEVDKFNGSVADYNSRCGHFKYRRGSLESVRAEVEARRSEIKRNAETAWARDTQGLSTSPKTDRRAPNNTSKEHNRPTPKARQTPDSRASASPGVQDPTRSPGLSEGNNLGKPDLSGLSESERSSIERTCDFDRRNSGPATYYTCVGNEIRKLAKSPSKPDLSPFSQSEREAIERTCDFDRRNSGPATYYTCVGNEIRKLAKSPSKPDISSFSQSERDAIERTCDFDRRNSGPATYYTCVGNEVRKLAKSPSKPDLSPFSQSEREAIERTCDFDRRNSGPATYYACVGNEVRKLAALPNKPDLSRFLQSEREAIERTCDFDRRNSGPATYYGCIGNEIRKMAR
jgi:hypothetical protein